MTKLKTKTRWELEHELDIMLYLLRHYRKKLCITSASYWTSLFCSYYFNRDLYGGKIQ